MAALMTHLNGHAAKVQPETWDFTRPPMKAVRRPEASIIMNGWIRMQFPATADTQRMFDLAPAAMKVLPGQLPYVAAETDQAAKQAIPALQQILAQNHNLVAPNADIGLSFAVVDGKLQYIFQIGVQTK